MNEHLRHCLLSKIFLFITLALCTVLISCVVYLSVCHSSNNLHSFSEPAVVLADDWTITDSSGDSRALSLPETITYGKDGFYMLSLTLPSTNGELTSPALRFYSNYVDLDIALDGNKLYSYPKAEAKFLHATGNTYHFVCLPVDYTDKTLTVSLQCQLGDDITYLLNAPLLGSKATMLNTDIFESLPSIILAGCMMILAIGLLLLYLTMRKRLKLNSAIIYTALFAILFAIYVCCETVFVQMTMPNGYLLCFTTLMLLALMPIPLMGISSEAVSRRFKPIIVLLMVLCSVNLITQIMLNFIGIMSVRVMLPATHAVIIISIITMALCLFFSDKAEKPFARRTLLSALPMIAGGSADIILLAFNQPSFNNSFWFTLGVATFIVVQFVGFVRSYFALYHTALESRLLRNMAYRDSLTNIGNRNAYELRLKELSKGQLTKQLCCIVIDINDLKQINDRFGHQAGDEAIMVTGKLINDMIPDHATCFRTGGDEFIVLIEEYDEPHLQELADKLTAETKQHNKQASIPLSLAIGFGSYKPSDGNIIDFIRRVDTQMYCHKSRLKSSPTYPLKSNMPRN